MVPEKAFFHEFHIEKGQVLQCLRRKTGTGTRCRYLPRKSMENQSLLQQLQGIHVDRCGRDGGFPQKDGTERLLRRTEIAVKRMCEKAPPLVDEIPRSDKNILRHPLDETRRGYMSDDAGVIGYQHNIDSHRSFPPYGTTAYSVLVPRRFARARLLLRRARAHPFQRSLPSQSFRLRDSARGLCTFGAPHPFSIRFPEYEDSLATLFGMSHSVSIIPLVHKRSTKTPFRFFIIHIHHWNVLIT